MYGNFYKNKTVLGHAKTVINKSEVEDASINCHKNIAFTFDYAGQAYLIDNFGEIFACVDYPFTNITFGYLGKLSEKYFKETGYCGDTGEHLAIARYSVGVPEPVVFGLRSVVDRKHDTNRIILSIDSKRYLHWLSRSAIELHNISADGRTVVSVDDDKIVVL